jgi:hypothetical protein
LLGNPDDETNTEAQRLSPEEQLVRDLVNLVVTIRDDGQVNSLTVVDTTQGVTRLYRIETENDAIGQRGCCGISFPAMKVTARFLIIALVSRDLVGEMMSALVHEVAFHCSV